MQRSSHQSTACAPMPLLRTAAQLILQHGDMTESFSLNPLTLTSYPQGVAVFLICALTYCICRFGMRLYYATAGGRKWCVRTCCLTNRRSQIPPYFSHAGILLCGRDAGLGGERGFVAPTFYCS